MTDSSTGGYLTAGADPIHDDDLDDFIQQVLVGITGLPGPLVRPRWQPEPPNLPAYGTDWMAFGNVHTAADVYGYTQHDPTGQGQDVERAHEVFDTMCSFYGPNADGMASRLRAGLMIAQNREQLFLAGMGVVACGDLVAAPVLIKMRWLNRSDITVTIKREVRRTYPVLNLLSVGGTLSSGTLTRNLRAG